MNATSSAKPAIFVDRDGTLIEEVNFLSRVEDLRLFSFTREAVRLLKDSGWLVIVVTNQSGIGREIFGENDMHAIHDAIQTTLGGAIDAFYFCPHSPDAGCECRKPGLGMLRRACADFDIDLARSWMIGDKSIDVQTADAGGLGSALVLTGYGRLHLSEMIVEPDVIAEHLLDAAVLITKSQLRFQPSPLLLAAAER